MNFKVDDHLLVKFSDVLFDGHVTFAWNNGAKVLVVRMQRLNDHSEEFKWKTQPLPLSLLQELQRNGQAYLCYWDSEEAAVLKL
jgi:hypothetical protein